MLASTARPVRLVADVIVHQLTKSNEQFDQLLADESRPPAGLLRFLQLEELVPDGRLLVHVEQTMTRPLLAALANLGRRALAAEDQLRRGAQLETLAVLLYGLVS